jgi:hypothetical protein
VLCLADAAQSLTVTHGSKPRLVMELKPGPEQDVIKGVQTPTVCGPAGLWPLLTSRWPHRDPQSEQMVRLRKYDPLTVVSKDASSC